MNDKGLFKRKYVIPYDAFENDEKIQLDLHLFK